MRSKYDNLSNEELIELLKIKSKELNKTLSVRDLGTKNDLPADGFLMKRFNCKSWNDVLIYCGFKPNRIDYNYTDEELLDILRSHSITLGKTPSSNETGKKYNIPSQEVYYRQFKTKSWNEILTLAGLKLNNFLGYTKEFAIERLIEYNDKFKVTPTIEGLKKQNWTPSTDYYFDKFGSFNNALYESGLIEEILTTEQRIQISIKELIKLANDLQRCPTVEEFESVKHKGLFRRALENNLKLKYNDICRQYIPNFSLNCTNGDITKDEIIDTLIKLKEKIGYVPFYKDLKKYNITYSYNLIQKVFNGLTYNQVIESLGLIPSYSTTITKSKEDMLNDYYNLFFDLKRLPTCNDIDNNKKISSYSSYLNRFGSIENVCNLLDIDYKSLYKGNGFGVVCFDKLGNLCKSYKEQMISNYFIDNNIRFEKEVRYKDLLGLYKMIFDWKLYINNKDGLEECYYIEYFGLYDRNPKNKITKEYLKKTKIKIKLLYKNDVINKCIFIFPYDIKNKSLDLIFKNIIST